VKDRHPAYQLHDPQQVGLFMHHDSRSATRDIYGSAIDRAFVDPKVGLATLRLNQAAGGWSDTSRSQIVVSKLLSKSCRFSMNLGAGRFSCKGIPGNVIIVPPKFAKHIDAPDDHEILLAAIDYDSLLNLVGPEHGMPIDGDFGRVHGGVHANTIIATLLDRLWVTNLTDAPYSALEKQGLILQLASELLRLRETPLKMPVGGLAPWQLKRVTEKLSADLSQDICLADLAALIDMSPFHLCRAFSASTGEPPHRWRTTRRVERAETLLVKTELPVTEIAAQVGYEAPSQLSTVFRDRRGMSPTEYRRRFKP
jgi:AraC family transcriptional regulator